MPLTGMLSLLDLVVVAEVEPLQTSARITHLEIGRAAIVSRCDVVERTCRLVHISLPWEYRKKIKSLKCLVPKRFSAKFLEQGAKPIFEKPKVPPGGVSQGN